MKTSPLLHVFILVSTFLSLGFGIEASRPRWSEIEYIAPVERSLGSDVIYFDGLPRDMNPEVEAHFDSALVVIDNSDFMGAIAELEALTPIVEGSELAAVFNLVGWCLLGEDELDDAIFRYHLSWEIAQGASDQIGQAVALDQIGSTYFINDGPPDSSLKYFQQALALYQTLGDQQGTAACLGAIGSVFHDLGRLDTALRCKRAALAVEVANSDWRAAGSEVLWTGDIFLDQLQPDSALSCYFRSLQFYAGSYYDVNEPLVLNHMSRLYNQQGKDWFIAAGLRQGKTQSVLDALAARLEQRKY
jgi:tetratricopeptide (TPR) repeat protein